MSGCVSNTFLHTAGVFAPRPAPHGPIIPIAPMSRAAARSALPLLYAAPMDAAGAPPGSRLAPAGLPLVAGQSAGRRGLQGSQRLALLAGLLDRSRSRLG